MKPAPTSVLIIEDDMTLRTAYEMVLRHDGFKVSVATDGAEGLEAARSTKPAVILLDMLMPNMNGLDFLRDYQPKQNNPEGKIIVLSNMSLPSDVREAMELGAAKYLTKSSFTPKEITSIIKEVLVGE